MKKIKGKWVAKNVFKRLFHPGHIRRYISLSRKKTKSSRSDLDTQLKLYSQILPGDFLHYGYFEDPLTKPEEIALADIQRAQLRYAELIIDGVADLDAPVLDVGCGTGGLIRLLLDKGGNVTGLTPDRFQVQYISEKYPGAGIIHSKFQKMESEQYADVFGTVINSESLQYISLAKAFEITDKILKPGGRWIIVDYFRTAEAHEKSGHDWDKFEEQVKLYRYKTIKQFEITGNIYPTLAFIHMWGEKLGVPLFEFLAGKLKRKHPRVHYLFDEVISELQHVIQDRLEIVNPETFIRNKKYMFVILQK